MKKLMLFAAAFSLAACAYGQKVTSTGFKASNLGSPIIYKETNLNIKIDMGEVYLQHDLTTYKTDIATLNKDNTNLKTDMGQRSDYIKSGKKTEAVFLDRQIIKDKAAVNQDKMQIRNDRIDLRRHMWDLKNNLRASACQSVST